MLSANAIECIQEVIHLVPDMTRRMGRYGGFSGAVCYVDSEKLHNTYLLGAGHFSVVIEHPDDADLVIKIAVTAEKDSCVDMLDMIWEGTVPEQAWMPEVLHREDVAGVPVYVMPKYQSSQEYSDIVFGIDTWGLPNKAVTATDEYLQCRDFLKEYMPNASFDLHTDNIMFCYKTSQIKFTDPVSFIKLN